MAASVLNPLVRYLSRLTAASSNDLSDTDLLERFRDRGEEAAFTLLLQRHGPAVLGVCRRLLGNGADVDDAFQATFLVLLRKARSIRRSASLGCWLYGVAYRVAVKARARRLPGLPGGNVVALSRRNPVAETLSGELAAVLDEEVGRLPERYRAAFVLCVLEGRTYEQAARELGSSKSSLGRQVERARALLQHRLVRRGIVASAGGLAAALAAEASAASVPAVLTLATVRLATRAVRNGAAIPGAVAELARPGVPGTPLMRLAAALVLIVAPSLGVAFLGDAEPDAGGTAAKPANAKAAVDGDGFPMPAEALARIGSARFRHGAYLRGLHYSPDGKLLSTTGGPRVRVWDVPTGKLVQQFPADDEVNLLDAVAKMLSVVPGQPASVGKKQLSGGNFTADGKSVVVVDGSTCRWFDVRTGRQTLSRELACDPEHGVALLAPHADKVVASDRDRRLVLFDLPSGKEVACLVADGSWQGQLVFAPDGKRLAVAERAGGKKEELHVRLFDPATGRSVGSFAIGNYHQTPVVFAADGKQLLAQDAASHVHVWSVPDGKPLYDVAAQAGLPTAVAFAPDGKSIVVGSQQFVAVRIDLATGKELARYPINYPSSTNIAFSPDGKELAIGVIDGVVSRWDLATGRRKDGTGALEALSQPMYFDPDDRLLHVWDGALSAVDWRAGRVRRRVAVPHTFGNFYLAQSPDHSRLAGINAAHKTVVWDAATGAERCVLAGPNDDWLAPVFAPDNKVLYTGQHDAPLRVWDAATGKELPGFDAPRRTDYRLAVSPDGRQLAVVSSPPEGPRDLVVWDTATRRKVWQLVPTAGRRIADVAFSPDGSRLVAVGGDVQQPQSTAPGFIRMWDLRTGNLIFADEDVPAGLYAVAFSADGRTLVTGDTAVVRLWEVFTGRERHQFHGHDSYVYGLAVSPDGKLVASVSCDAPLFVWDVEGCFGKPPSDAPFSDAEKASLWTALADRDATPAFDALRQLLARPGPAVALLRERLRPSVAVDDKAVQRLLSDLAGEDAGAQEKAVAALQMLADRAEPRLLKALTDKPSDRVKHRLENVLQMASRDVPELRRQVRAVEALERLGSPPARDVLKALAGGAADARQTREARSAVERLKGR